MHDSAQNGIPNGAVFLSYASQDAEAAKRICEALSSHGIEVWFDQSELRGGEAWDTKIKKQIRECALFVPIVSANTQARPEGYFRLEWRFAAILNARNQAEAEQLASANPAVAAGLMTFEVVCLSERPEHTTK
jgi:hypothetical protein